MKSIENSSIIHSLVAPVYHRQRLLLFLLEQAGGRLSKMDFQKLLFLYTQESGTGHYAFVPFRFGCYSFQANDDLDLLCKRGWIVEKGNELILQAGFSGKKWALESMERSEVRKWVGKCTVRGQELLQLVYKDYPYYAIHSEIKETVLDKSDLAQVETALPQAGNGEVLYTIGYEGLQFEDYANKLIKNGVKLLCDVRRNPLSRKFGYSKRNLSTILPRLGIAYSHVPELGIVSESRKDLKTSRDRELLFEGYAQHLPEHRTILESVLEMLRQHGRIALTCFEHEPDQCHRHCVSEYLSAQFGVKVVHL